jgi:hypothetical protein
MRCFPRNWGDGASIHAPALALIRLFDLGQLAADLLVGRPFLVVDLDKFPALDSLGT